MVSGQVSSIYFRYIHDESNLQLINHLEKEKSENSKGAIIKP